MAGKRNVGATAPVAGVANNAPETPVVPPVTPETSPAPVAAPKKKAVSLVRFSLKKGGTREFSPADHGEGFIAIADQFGETNKIEILTREDIAA